MIIPIYNVEPYLGRCIDSVLRSDYRDFELILVDDGSTDGCLHLCREYAGRDPRVKVISQENKGVSTARNRGLDVCRGEWVVFVDADDCISPDHLTLVAGAEDTDLLLFDFAASLEELTSGSRTGTAFHYGRADVPGLAERILDPRQLRENGQINFRSANGKAFKKAVIDQCALRFDPDVSYGEDKLFNLEYALHIERYTYLPVPVYFYEKHISSLSRSYHQGQINSFIKLMEKLWAVREGGRLPPTAERAYNNCVLDHTRYMLDYACYILTEVIFYPSNPASKKERYATCARLRKEAAFNYALKQIPRYGDLSRKILLSAFCLRWYRVTGLLCAVVHFRRRRRERRAAASRDRETGDHTS